MTPGDGSDRRAAGSASAGEQPDRRASLVAGRLISVARAAGLSDVTALEPGHPRGAAVRGVAAGRECWWVDTDGARPHLGAALAWVSARADWDAQHLTLVHESADCAAVDSRRAGLFDVGIDVRRFSDGEAVPVVPSPHAPLVVPADGHLALAESIVRCGAEVVVEHGVVSGEVAGLEVCRVVDGASGEAILAVGVGEHDRETFAVVHGHRPIEESLRSVVEHVAPHRSPGAAPHPLNRIARSRLLRSRATAQPALVGARVLTPVEPPVPRENLKDAVPCLASREDGSLVCFVAGVDLESVPFLLDAVARSSASDRAPALALVARDLVPSVARVALTSSVPVEIIILPDGIG